MIHPNDIPDSRADGYTSSPKHISTVLREWCFEVASLIDKSSNV